MFPVLFSNAILSSIGRKATYNQNIRITRNCFQQADPQEERELPWLLFVTLNSDGNRYCDETTLWSALIQGGKQ